jgi:hypothetical protein
LLLFYLFVAYGICFGVQNKLPFLYSTGYLESGVPERFTDKLLHCTYCTGFHCGWLTWLLAWGVEADPPGQTDISIPFSVLTFALASAAFCYVADGVVKWAEANTYTSEGE